MDSASDRLFQPARHLCAKDPVYNQESLGWAAPGRAAGAKDTWAGPERNCQQTFDFSAAAFPSRDCLPETAKMGNLERFLFVLSVVFLFEMS